VLNVTDLTVRWGAVTAVDGVSLAVGRGEMVALVGPNGTLPKQNPNPSPTGTLAVRFVSIQHRRKSHG